MRKVEKYRREEEFRKINTAGGWYSEADMRKPVSEGGLGYSALLGLYMLDPDLPFLPLEDSCMSEGMKIPRRKTRKTIEFCEMHGLTRCPGNKVNHELIMLGQCVAAQAEQVR